MTGLWYLEWLNIQGFMEGVTEWWNSFVLASKLKVLTQIKRVEQKFARIYGATKEGLTEEESVEKAYEI